MFIVFSIFSSTVLSEPFNVYRVDTRGPDEVFANGFNAWGNDYNIVAHINGATCSTVGSTSAFISTARSYQAAVGIVERHLEQREVTYLYSIRADDNFYSGPASIDYFQQFSPLSPLSLNSLHMARRADEWDAVDVIPTENIRNVLIVHRDGTPEAVSNPRYSNIDTTGNPLPYTAHAEDTLQHFGFPVTLPGDGASMLSSCFGSCYSSTKQSSCYIEKEYSINMALMFNFLSE